MQISLVVGYDFANFFFPSSSSVSFANLANCYPQFNELEGTQISANSTTAATIFPAAAHFLSVFRICISARILGITIIYARMGPLTNKNVR